METVDPRGDWHGETPTHAGLGIYTGTRWRYPEGSNTVFWWEQPTKEEQWAVEGVLAKRGYRVLHHKEMVDGSIEDEISHGRKRLPKEYRTSESIDRIFESKEGCPLCGKPAIGGCRCSSRVKHDVGDLINGHGSKCENGHRWSIQTADGKLVVWDGR